MKTQVRFRASKFPPYPQEEEEINPGLWGKRLAEYLVQELNQKGIHTGSITAEDWGWFIPVTNLEHPLAVCCGHQDGDDNEFLVFTDPTEPVVRKFFRKIDVTAPLSKLTSALEEILSSDPDIQEVQWESAA